MFRTSHKLALLLLAAGALMTAGCGSNNKDKIIGKWKLTEPPTSDAEAKQGFEMMAMMGIYMYFEFNADGSVVMGFDAEKPGTLEFMKQGLPGGKVTFPAKYKLLSGNKVELYDLSAEAKQLMKGAAKGKMVSEIVIDGEKMTIKDPDGTITKLERYKAGPAPTNPGVGAGAAMPQGPDTEDARPKTAPKGKKN